MLRIGGHRKKRGYIDALLLYYCLWGLAATGFSLVFLVLLSVAALAEKAGIGLLAVLLLTGFLWIGTTVISRHIYILLKSYLGKKVTTLQFVSTQLVFFLFPFVYRQLRNEAAVYRQTMTAVSDEGE